MLVILADGTRLGLGLYYVGVHDSTEFLLATRQLRWVRLK